MRLQILLVMMFVLCLPAVFAIDVTQDSVNRSGEQDNSISGTFTVSNNESAPIDVSFSGLTVSKGSDSMSVSLSPSSISALGAGSSRLVSFSVDAAANQLTGRYTGTISASTNSSRSDTVQLSVNVTENDNTGLALQEVRITVHYPQPDNRFNARDDGDANVLDGEEAEVDIYPGSEVEFDLVVENLFSGSDDIDLDNVLVEVTIEDIDDGDDLEQDSSEFDLESGNDEEIEMRFAIPIEVEAQAYTTTITVEAEDDAENTYRVERTIELPVRKESHDLRILSTDATPSTVACGDAIRLQATMVHVGNGVEENAGFRVVNEDLGINHLEEGIELEEEPNEDESRFLLDRRFNLPTEAQPGLYTIEYLALYQARVTMERQTEEIRVTCESAEEQDQDTGSDDNQDSSQDSGQIEQPSTPDQGTDEQGTEQDDATRNESGEPIIVGSSSQEGSFFSSPLGIVAILLGNVIIVVGLVMLISKLLITRTR